uniref:glutathione transferase n=2 Tax=Perna viridis TaxID=73031 RepID=R9S1K9_PERVI|nr:glutathione S-transferase pi [Perna viridis]
MPSLAYFPVRGRGESIRTLLIDNDIAFEEVNVLPRENWENNWKPKMQFGQCPSYTDDDGFQLVQSNAILRYLGRKYDLYGSNNQEASLVDMINDGVEDVRIQYTRMIYQNYEAGKEPYIQELPKKLEPFEKLIKSSGYILGEKISWADYNLYDFLDIQTILSPGCLDSFPNLKAYLDRMKARPGVQKRRQTDNFKNMPVNGNGKQ